MTENEVKQAVNAVIAIRNLTPLERSFKEYYARCKRNNNVPVTCAGGGWYHKYGKNAICALYLRLPEKVQKEVIAPEGLDRYKLKLLKKLIEANNEE